MCEVLIFDYSQPFDQQEYDHLVENSACRGLSSRKRVTHVIRVSPSGRLSVESFADPYREHAYANVPWVTAVIGSKRYSGYMVAYANHIQLLSVDDADGCVCVYSESLEGWMCEVLIIDYSQPFDQQEYDRLFQESTPNDGFVTTPGEAMTASGAERSTSRLAGYAALTERYGVEVIPNWHASRVAAGTIHHIDSHAGIVEEVFPAWYWPGDRLGDQLEFALKHDGTNLAILAALFRVAPQNELLAYVKSKPTGKHTRRLWFLYEFLTGRNLPLDDLNQGNYVALLDWKKYYTVGSPRRVRRQRIYDNLLGGRRFCPTVRCTNILDGFEAVDLASRCQTIAARSTPTLLRRVIGNLYMKEAKSSFEIEHITPSSTRTERFVALLRLAQREDFCSKPQLIDLQNRIVDARFRDADYRRNQNYVGEAAAPGNERIHFVSPRPEDLGALMDGLTAAHERMAGGGVPVAIHAAAIAYGFVFLHPFEDGNGRIHRFLIHNILARRGFTPADVMVPVSATMLKNASDYDASLEAFSAPLMPLVEYTLDAEGRLTVHNDTADWYRYPDLTTQAEALFRFIDRTIDTELAGELAFLTRYDAAEKGIQGIVDMPDRQIDLFIRFCSQNDGRLSARKRASHFGRLSDEDIASMERVVRTVYSDG